MTKIAETTGKLATTAIGALKGHPGLLVLTLLNLVVFGFVYFAVSNSRAQQAKEFELIMQRCYGAPSNQG